MLSLESDSVRIILLVYKQYYPPTCHLNPLFFLSVEIASSSRFILCLGVYRLFISNKRQNSWTDRVQILYRTSRKVYEWSKLKISLQQNSIFIKFLKIHEYFDKSANFFVCVLFYNLSKEKMFNLNRRWAGSNLKALWVKIWVLKTTS